jgi:hypothetical protein
MMYKTGVISNSNMLISINIVGKMLCFSKEKSIKLFFSINNISVIKLVNWLLGFINMYAQILLFSEILQWSQDFHHSGLCLLHNMKLLHFINISKNINFGVYLFQQLIQSRASVSGTWQDVSMRLHQKGGSNVETSLENVNYWQNMLHL